MIRKQPAKRVENEKTKCRIWTRLALPPAGRGAPLSPALDRSVGTSAEPSGLRCAPARRRPGRHPAQGLGRKQASYSSGPMPVALFLLPPSEPDVQLLTASGSPVPLIIFRKLDEILPVHMKPRSLGAFLMGRPYVTSMWQSWQSTMVFLRLARISCTHSGTLPSSLLEMTRRVW